MLLYSAIRKLKIVKYPAISGSFNDFLIRRSIAFSRGSRKRGRKPSAFWSNHEWIPLKRAYFIVSV